MAGLRAKPRSRKATVSWPFLRPDAETYLLPPVVLSVQVLFSNGQTDYPPDPAQSGEEPSPPAHRLRRKGCRCKQEREPQLLLARKIRSWSRAHHKEEIRKLIGKTQQKGLTLIPTRMYFKNGKIKVELALAKGKQQWDKRETERRRTADKEAREAISRVRKQG